MNEPPDERSMVERIAVLEAAVAELQASLAREVRTRRVVVVDRDGFERVVIGAPDGFGHVTVRARTRADGSTCVELFANDPADGDGAEVGVALSAGGELVATLSVFEGRPAALWLGDE